MAYHSKHTGQEIDNLLDGSVQVTPQELTEEQKSIARKNIGISSGGVTQIDQLISEDENSSLVLVPILLLDSDGPTESAPKFLEYIKNNYSDKRNCLFIGSCKDTNGKTYRVELFVKEFVREPGMVRCYGASGMIYYCEGQSSTTNYLYPWGINDDGIGIFFGANINGIAVKSGSSYEIISSEATDSTNNSYIAVQTIVVDSGDSTSDVLYTKIADAFINFISKYYSYKKNVLYGGSFTLNGEIDHNYRIEFFTSRIYPYGPSPVGYRPREGSGVIYYMDKVVNFNLADYVINISSNISGEPGGDAQTLDGYPAVAYGDKSGYQRTYHFDALNSNTNYIKLGTLPLTTQVDSESAYADFEITGFNSKIRSGGVTLLVHAHVFINGTLTIEHNAFGSGQNFEIFREDTDTNYGIWLRCTEYYSTSGEITIKRSHGFTPIMERISPPTNLRYAGGYAFMKGTALDSQSIAGKRVEFKTKAEYDALTEKMDNTLYIITD